MRKFIQKQLSFRNGSLFKLNKPLVNLQRRNIFSSETKEEKKEEEIENKKENEMSENIDYSKMSIKELLKSLEKSENMELVKRLSEDRVEMEKKVEESERKEKTVQK